MTTIDHTSTDHPMLKTSQILDARLDDWRKLAQALHGRFRTGDFVTGLRFVAAVAEAADAAGHHPDIKLAYPYVDVTLISHDAVYRPGDGGPERRVSWVTQRDVDLARQISEIAHDQGIAAEPQAVAMMELGLDTADLAAAGPFWNALLTGTASEGPSDEVRDATGRVPVVWFQHTDAHETPRQRFHIDLWLPHDVAEQRIAAAVDAGGTIVDDSEAPSYVVLSDPEGNRACVCTCLQR